MLISGNTLNDAKLCPLLVSGEKLTLIMCFTVVKFLDLELDTLPLVNDVELKVEVFELAKT